MGIVTPSPAQHPRAQQTPLASSFVQLPLGICCCCLPSSSVAFQSEIEVGGRQRKIRERNLEGTMGVSEPCIATRGIQLAEGAMPVDGKSR